ncbi:hypothetical protein RJ639_009188 [Escallonia herrerae]|uniref:Reverse transcriptase zinc-binding domain-containing protein n=1 Tax=Escallonia herrerae TaxID=1293975 RepID=A0AA88VRQ6_9ASTE|nr:hypothetical protein RJ639_009188 [Escallonia herrerae]
MPHLDLAPKPQNRLVTNRRPTSPNHTCSESFKNLEIPLTVIKPTTPLNPSQCAQPFPIDPTLKIFNPEPPDEVEIHTFQETTNQATQEGLVHNSLPTNSMRAIRGLKTTPSCDLCHDPLEDTIHVLRKCHAAQEVWKYYLPQTTMAEDNNLSMQN